jgi:hypothetical protein
MVDVATADDTPYSFEKEDKIEEERRGCRDGLGVANGPDQMADWAAFLLILPFFFWKLLLLFLQHSVERRRGGFGKICKQVIKLDFDLKQFFKVCKY